MRKKTKIISIFLTLIILIETLLPNIQNIAYGVEEIIEEVESQSEEENENENEEPSEEVSNLEIDDVQEEDGILNEEEKNEELVSEEQAKLEKQITGDVKKEDEEEQLEKDEQKQLEDTVAKQEKIEEVPIIEEKAEQQEEIIRSEKNKEIANKYEENIVNNNENITNTKEIQNTIENNETDNKEENKIENNVLNENIIINTEISNKSDITENVVEIEGEQELEQKLTENIKLEEMLVSEPVRTQMLGESIIGGEIADSIYLADETEMLGSGTEEDPYIITNATDFYNIRNDTSAHYKLGADIDIRRNYNSWTSIPSFSGSLDGENYTISNCLMRGQYGLFSNNSGTIKNIKLKNITTQDDTCCILVSRNNGIIKNIEAENINIGGYIANVGGLVETNYGSIENSYVIGTIRQSIDDDIVGGLVGTNSGGTIKNCYAACTITAGSSVGGLVGKNSSGNISNCFATGEVSGSNYIGGLVGESSNGNISNCFTTASVTGRANHGALIGKNATIVSNCYAIGNVNDSDTISGKGLISSNSDEVINSYWTPETTNKIESAGGEIRFLYQMQYQNSYKDWDFEETWAIGDGEKATTAYLRDMPIPESVYLENYNPITFEGGDGTEENPYIIVTSKQLESMKLCLSAHYKLGANIDLISYKNWEPLGNETNKFTGSLDGAEYKISNLNIIGENTYRGLFGYNIGKLKNIKLENVNIKGTQYIGGLVGYNKDGIIENCSVTGNITGDSEVGGLVGYMYSGSITQSYAIATVNGTTYTGGLVGYMYLGSITQSYATATVNGVTYTGGLVGYTYLSASITQSYVTEIVNGTQYTGGLVGYINSMNAEISNCYTTNIVTVNGDYVGGLVGYNYGKITLCYTVGSVNGENLFAGGLVGYSYKNATIEKCYSVSNVTGNNYIGGLAGYNTGIISNCYATGKVEGNSEVGSLIGNDKGELINCYGIGKVTATGSNVGGLIGLAGQSNVTNSYWTPETTKQLIGVKGTRMLLFQMQYESGYKDWDFEEVWGIGDGTKATIAYLKELPIPQSVYMENHDPILFESGDGSEENPFIIVTPRQLEAMNYCLYAHYKLGANIDLEDYENWSPIGVEDYRFTGSLDGAEYKISNLKITDTENYKGLFGYNEGRIKNIKLENVDIEGKGYIGAIVGINDNGIIEQSYVTGTVIGNDRYVGGIAGVNLGIIERSYVTGTVIGNSNYVGGLVGKNESTIKNCFSTADVKGISYVASLIGNNDSGSQVINCYGIGKVEGNSNVYGLIRGGLEEDVTNSYWAADTTGQALSEGGTKCFLIKMQYQTTYEEWDFENIWAIGDGDKITTAYLKNMPIPESVYIDNIDGKIFTSGDGSEENPYIIMNPKQLEAINLGLEFHYKLGADIDLKDYENWNPIGDNKYRFTGSLDGEEYKISNLKITGEENYKGLFEYNDGIIKNIKLENVDIEGRRYIGGIVGLNDTGIIEQCYVTGTITGSDDSIGGLVGKNNENAKITQCYTNVNLVGEDYIGGLVGDNIGTITECYAIGDVIGNNYIGGLVGDNTGIIRDCYATGNVEGKSNVGSFIGINPSGNVTNCYGIGRVTATGSNIGGLIGSGDSSNVINSYWPPETVEQIESAGGEMTTIARMYKQNNYNNWNFDEIWAIDEDSIAYLKHIPKPESVKVLDPDIVKPKNVTVRHIEETLGYSSATFEISAKDTYAGIEKFELYIDNQLVDTIILEPIELGEKTATITVEGIEGNADIHEYYVIAINAEGFSRKSDYYRFILKPLPIVKITSNNIEYTNQDLDISMEANLSDGFIIEYKTSLDTEENDWKTYTAPFKVSENQTIYARVNDTINCGVESEYVVNNIDKLKPEFTGTYSKRQLTLNLKDIGTSGIKSYQYVILSDAPDKVNMDNLVYGEEILVTEDDRVLKNEFRVKINVRNTGSNYVYVKVFDYAENFEVHSFGEYYIPGNIVNIEVEAVSGVNENIKLGGAKFELKVNNPYVTDNSQIITTNNDGLAKFQIFGREEGEYAYTLSELQVPKGYKKINDAVLKVEYNYYGEVLTVTSLSANVVVEKVEAQLIKIKILNEKELGPDYQVAVKAVDEYNEEILLNEIEYKIEVEDENNENISFIGKTGKNESGLVILDGLRGNGEITIKVKQNKGILGYIFNEEKESILVINRNEETEEITVNTKKSDFDVEYEIDYKHRTIIIIDKNRPKEKQSKLVLNVQNKCFNEITNISGLDVVLEQPYELGKLTAKTDENGVVSFDDIIPLSEGEYLYKLNVNKIVDFEAKEIQLKVTFDDNKNIVKVEEMTEELTSINVVDEEDETIVYKIHNLNLLYEVELEYIDLKIEEKDRTEGFALEGISYRVESNLADMTLVKTGTTDKFGEITTSIVKQEQVIVKILEKAMIDGYVLESVEKTLVLDLNLETGFMEVNEELTDDTLDVEIEVNTGRIIIKETSMKKIELKDKANICFFITKSNNLGNSLEGVKFKFEETVTGLSEILETDESGAIEYHDFKVSEVGTYTFVITELETVPGHKLWRNPVILDITYELVDDEFTATKVIVQKGYENIQYKHCDEYETELEYQLDVELDLVNEKLDEPIDTMENLKFKKVDAKTKEPLVGVEFDLNIVYEDGKSIKQSFETDELGEYLIEEIDIPEGTTVVELKELEANPGYILVEDIQIIKFIRTGEELKIESGKISVSEGEEFINIEIPNEMEEIEEEEPENPEEPDTPVDPDDPDTPVDPDGPDTPEEPDTPVAPDNPEVPVDPDNPDTPVNPDYPEKPQPKYDFDINIINENKYNSDLRLEGSKFNVKIKKFDMDIFNKNVTLSRYPLYKNTMELKNISFEDDMTIEIKQLTAPLHHTINLNVYRLYISRDGSIGDIYLNGTNITDDAEVIIENDNMKFNKNGDRINIKNNKIIIKIKNEPSDFMVGVTKLDAIEQDVRLANAAFSVGKYLDTSAADLKTIGFLETDENGYGNMVVSQYETNTTTLYTLKELNPPEGYESAGTAGIYITTDINGDIINARFSSSFTQTGFEIKKFEGKYIEFEVKNRREPLPTYNIVLEDSNSENEEIKVWRAKYNVKVIQEIGADISANVTTNINGLASVKRLMGTRKIEITVKQIEKAQGYLIDSVEHKIVIDRDVSEIIQNGEKQVIHTIKLNDETDSDIEVIIDDVKKEVIIKLQNEPDFGMFIEKVDSADEDVRLNGGIFKLTSTENNDSTVETDDNGMAFIDLGKAVTNKTVKYTITEMKPPLGFKQIEPIDISVTFNDSGHIENIEVLGDRTEVFVKDKTNSQFTLRIDNREDKEFVDQENETTFNLELTKHNLRNNDITVENVIFDIFVKSEDGRHKKAIKTSNEDGKIFLNRIQGYGKIRIELTELESATGYKLDGETRIITLYKEKGEEQDIIRLIPEETSNDLKVRLDENSQQLFVDFDNELSDYVLGLAIEKQDSVDITKKLPKANFIIKDELNNEEYSLTTNSNGIGLVALPFHAEPGIHSYRIKEEKAPLGYFINTEVLTLQVIYNENWDLEKVELLNGDGFAKVVTAERNYVQLSVTNEAKPPIDPFDLVITKADWSDYKITIPDTLLSIDVKDTEYGLEENKTELTDADGNIYMEELYGTGTIAIDITELEPAENRRFDGLEKKVTIIRDIETGKMKLETSLNVDTIIDNENKKVQVIVRNKELPGLFTVVLEKLDKDTLEKMAGVEFELQAEGASEAIKGVTDDEGRIEFEGIEMPGVGTYPYKLKEVATLEGYKLLDEVSFDITFKEGDKEAGEDPIIIATAELMNNKENAEIVKVLPQYVKLDVLNEKEVVESDEEIEEPEEDVEEPEEDIEEPEEDIEEPEEDIEEPEEDIEKTEDVLEEIFKDIEGIIEKEQVESLNAFIKENFVADLKEDYFEYEEKEDDDDEKEKDEENKTIDVFNLEDDKEYIIKPATKTGFTLMLGLLILVACLFRNLEIYVLTNGEYKLVKKLRRGRFNKKVDLSKYFDEDEELNTIKLVMKNRLNKVLGGDKLEIKLQKQEFKRSVDKDEDEYIIVKTRTNREKLLKEDDTELYEELDNELVEELDIEKELKDEKEDNNSK